MDKSVLVAIGYARTSGALSPEASIPNQVDMIQEYCKENNMLLKQVFIDEKKSGMSTDKRSEYQKLKEVILQGKVDAVVVAFSDRLARESFEFILTMQQMKRHGVDFISVREDLQGSRMTALEIAMIGIRNEMENNTRARRVKDGKLQAIKRGEYIFSFPPFGYSITEDKKLEVIEEEVEEVKFIFNAYEQGKSLIEIARELKGYQFQRKGSYNIITKILEDSIYTGERELPPNLQKDLPKERIKAPAVISKEQFNRVQLLREKLKQKRRAPSFYFLTRGVFQCPNCQGNLNVHSPGMYYYCKHCRSRKDVERFKYPMDVLDKKALDFLNDWIDSQRSESNESSAGEQLLKRKSQNERAFAVGNVSYDTYIANAQKIIQRYRDLDDESFFITLSETKTLKSLIQEGKLEKVKAYMEKNKVKLSLNSKKEVILVE